MNYADQRITLKPYQVFTLLPLLRAESGPGAQDKVSREPEMSSRPGGFSPFASNGLTFSFSERVSENYGTRLRHIHSQPYP